MSNLDSASYNRQGKMYMACNPANKATTALSTTATGLILYNPWGSGKRLIVVDAVFAFSAVPTAAGAVMLSAAGSVSQAATPAGTAAVVYHADCSGVSTGNAGKVFTIATLPVVNVYIRPVSVASTTSGSGTHIRVPEGGITIVPGNYLHFSHVTTVATGIGSYLWIEVPE